MNLRRDRLIREARGVIAGALDLIAETCGKLSDRIDPPRPYADLPPGTYLVEDPDRGETIVPTPATDARAREESLQRQECRNRHPAYHDRPQTLLGEVAPPEPALAPVVPLRPEESP